MASADVILGARARRRALTDEQLPYIEAKHVVNPGMGDEHEVTDRIPLFDAKGSPYSWLDEHQINYWLAQGWELTGYGNFDNVRKHDGGPWEQLEAVRPLI